MSAVKEVREIIGDEVWDTLSNDTRDFPSTGCPLTVLS